MKNFLRAIIIGFLGTSIVHAQPAAPAGPNFSAAMSKVFGDNQAFSATMELQTTDPQKGDAVTMPGKVMFDSGKSRFEMDMSQLKSSRISPEQAAQLKQMGMETIVTIVLPDKKMSYLVYPGLQSYVETPMQNAEASESPADFKVLTTQLGKETVDGHPCIKNQVLVIGKQSQTNEFIVWSATDLKNFPVKLQTEDKSNPATMLFKNVSFSKPDAAQFAPPAAYTKYDSMMGMMRDQMMKQMGGAMFGR
jgi:hypothetical protein